jgi:hypothetical protein
MNKRIPVEKHVGDIFYILGYTQVKIISLYVKNKTRMANVKILKVYGQSKFHVDEIADLSCKLLYPRLNHIYTDSSDQIRENH